MHLFDASLFLCRNRNWSKLLEDLTHLIVGKVCFYPHYSKFAAACASWYKITKEVHSPFRQSSMSLVLPYNHETNKCPFYQIYDSKTYELNLPELRDKFFYGCSDGWLVVGDNNLGLSLINPITRRRIELPELSIAVQFLLQNSVDMDHMLDPFSRHFTLSKLVISESPSSSNDYRVAAILSSFQKLYVCQFGDKSWTDPFRSNKF